MTDVRNCWVFQIALEGAVGKGYHGTIAVDDTALIPGYCPTQFDFAPTSGKWLYKYNSTIS